jgi:GTP-binding protein
MIPVIAIVGRPNVGKSTLFNYLTKSRAALVASIPGLTRDRIYGEGKIDEHAYIAIDTGGLEGAQQGLENLIATQVLQAIQEADAILFTVDGREGLTTSDEIIANKLRRLHKTIFLVVNKTDGIDIDTAVADFYQLGLGEPYPIAALHGRGVTTLLNKVLTQIPVVPEHKVPRLEEGIKIAFIGRPNVGKSTLINRILGEQRVIVSEIPGTTRESIFIPFTRRNKNYTLIDTAGIRRRHKITEKIEKFSIVKSLQAINEANVVVLVIDAKEGITEQDLRLLRFILDAGRALVITINKWDKLTHYEREQVKKELDRRLTFIDFAELHFISALHGTRVNNVFASINKAFHSATKKMPTPQLTRILQRAITAHKLPLAHGKEIKLLYAHAGGYNPPLIIIHGKQTHAIPKSYRKYLEKVFRDALNLTGTPIRIEFRSNENG